MKYRKKPDDFTMQEWDAEFIAEFSNHARSILEELRASREAMECIINRYEGNTKGQSNCARAHLEKFVKK